MGCVNANIGNKGGCLTATVGRVGSNLKAAISLSDETLIAAISRIGQGLKATIGIVCTPAVVPDDNIILSIISNSTLIDNYTRILNNK